MVGTVFRPAKVYLQDGIVPQPLVLREMPTVTIDARFVDSLGRPTRGHFVGLWGALPGEQPAQALPMRQWQQACGCDKCSSNGLRRQGFAATINGPEHEDATTQILQWSAQLTPDAAGRVTFRAPRA